jgi:hypothetical protein
MFLPISRQIRIHLARGRSLGIWKAAAAVSGHVRPRARPGAGTCRSMSVRHHSDNCRPAAGVDHQQQASNSKGRLHGDLLPSESGAQGPAVPELTPDVVEQRWEYVPVAAVQYRRFQDPAGCRPYRKIPGAFV